jgi:excinuclease ABC subunit C
MTQPFDHKNFLANVGNSAGVYQMFDDQEDLLYVGKAKDLKKRLSSYFRKTGLPIKTATMMKKVVDIQVTVTHTEDEALILEANLIKQNKPRYNILLRDSKSYPFIHIDTSHPFPRLSFYRGERAEAGKFFGPYPGVTAIRETLSLLQKVLPVRQCEDVFYNNRSRPCLQHQIKRCSAPCVGLISEQDYQQDIKLAELFLQGKDTTLNKQLSAKMDQAAKSLNYEEAAQWRDRINALTRVQSHQTITSGHSDIDILTAAAVHGKYCVEITFIRGGRHSGNRGFFPKVTLESSLSEVISAFITQHYHNRQAPKEIIVGEKLEDRDFLQKWLTRESNRKVVISDSVRGHRKDWLDMAQLNVRERLKRQMAKTESVAKQFQLLTQLLNLDEPVERLECFDISHTQGAQTVASCVVFDLEGAKKSDYRRFNIKNITPGDDYAALEQAVKRRYQRIINGEGVYPDVLLIDGGKGQLSSVRKIMQELGLSSLPLAGVAKGEGRKAGLETLFIDGRKNGVVLANHPEAMHLINSIRDEAHRFAIAGHRAKRQKQQTKSVLQDIPGVGAKRRQAILKHFGGIQGVQRAGIKDLAQVPGISQEMASTIYNFLKS